MNIYKKKDGTVVVMGEVESISPDRMSMVVKTIERSQEGTSELKFTVPSTIAYDDRFKPGFNVTVIGGMYKGKINDATVLSGNASYSYEDVSVISGFVRNVFLNKELNEDGTHKMTKPVVDETTGQTKAPSPKKQHIDISIAVNNAGKWVDHVIKVYDVPAMEGNTSQFERINSMFKNFDAKTNRIYATFVTRPGVEMDNTWIDKDGNERHSFREMHMGYTKFDLKYIDAERERTQENQSRTQATNSQTQPTTSAPSVSPVTPASPVVEPVETPAPSGSGFAEMPTSNDFDELCFV